MNRIARAPAHDNPPSRSQARATLRRLLVGEPIRGADRHELAIALSVELAHRGWRRRDRIARITELVRRRCCPRLPRREIEALDELGGMSIDRDEVRS